MEVLQSQRTSCQILSRQSLRRGEERRIVTTAKDTCLGFPAAGPLFWVCFPLPFFLLVDFCPIALNYSCSQDGVLHSLNCGVTACRSLLWSVFTMLRSLKAYLGSRIEFHGSGIKVYLLSICFFSNFRMAMTAKQYIGLCTSLLCATAAHQ